MHSPLTDPAYVARQRATYSKAMREAHAEFLKPKPLGDLDPMMKMSALAMPMLNMKLASALQISMEKSVYEIDVEL